MKAKLRDIKEELRWRMHESIPEQGKWLTQVITGFFGYHAVPTNGRAIVAFHHHVTDLWRRSLRRRSQKDRAIELYHRAERLSPYDPSDG
jgi:hypothetical protein